MEFWIKAGQLLLSLSILVILHEFGHYLPAVLFKTRVEKFYLFFDPWFSLFKRKIKDTEWGIGWLPLGGYVKIAGMVDESMDKEQLAKPAEPWEFRSKKTWQRLIIMLGGVTVNLIVGVLIYIFIAYAYGDERLAPEKMKYGASVHPYLNQYGIHSGDKILKINGEKLNDINEANRLVLLQDGRKILVEHPDGKQETITLPEKIDYSLFKEGAFPAFNYRAYNVPIKATYAWEKFELDGKKCDVGTQLALINGKKPDASVGTFQVGQELELINETDTIRGVVSEKNIAALRTAFKAHEAGLRPDDQLLNINGNSVRFYDELTSALYKTKAKKAKIRIKRGDLELDLEVPVSKDHTIGIAFMNMSNLDYSRRDKITYSFGESIGVGVQDGYHTLSDYISQMRFLFTEKGAGSIGGFGTMGKLFGATWDWHRFWLTTALISIILAFMNILPIPALDGGHVVFLIYEMITGREAPQKILEYAQIVGIVLLLSLMLYANGNDIYQHFFK